MKAQVLNLGSESLVEFREKLDAALAVAVNRMKEKWLMQASVTGKIKITLEEQTDSQGEIHTLMKLEPEVNVNMSTKGKVQCGTQSGLFVQLDEEGRPVIGSCQVDIDELLAREEGA